MIDAVAGGTLNSKTPEQAQDLIEQMTMNNYQWSTARTKLSRQVGVYDVDAVTALAAQMEAMNKKIDGLTLSQNQSKFIKCDSYREEDGTQECSGVSNYSGTVPRNLNKPYNNTYKSGWRNHPNFSWGGQGQQRPNHPPGFQQQPPQEKKPNLEELMSKFLQAYETRFQAIETSM